MICNGVQKIGSSIVKKLDLAAVCGISRVFLLQHFDHHVVCGLVNEGNQHVLSVDLVSAVCILLHGFFADFPDKIPGQSFGKGVAKLFHVGFVYVADLCGTHEGQGIVMSGKGALLQKLGDDLIAFYRVKFQFVSAQAVVAVCHQVIQRNHSVISGQISGNVVRVGNAYIGGGVCGNVGDNIVVNFAVIGVKPQIYSNVGVQGFELGDSLFVDFCLGFVGVVFGPEGDFIVLGGIKFFRVENALCSFAP